MPILQGGPASSSWFSRAKRKGKRKGKKKCRPTKRFPSIKVCPWQKKRGGEEGERGGGGGVGVRPLSQKLVDSGEKIQLAAGTGEEGGGGGKERGEGKGKNDTRLYLSSSQGQPGVGRENVFALIRSLKGGRGSAARVPAPLWGGGIVGYLLPEEREGGEKKKKKRGGGGRRGRLP